MSLFAELKRRNVIRVVTAYVVSAWVIVQVAETTFPFIGFSDIAIRNVIVILAIGIVPAFGLAWIYQVTPEGLRRDTGEGRTDPRATRLLDRGIIVVLVLGISYFAFDKFVLAPERAAEREAQVIRETEVRVRTGFYGDRSIAVLPFENLSSDAEQRYLGDGIAEEVLNLLASIRELRVISRSSAFALRDQNLDIPEVAERLDVAHVLEGSVRKSGNRVRVTAQLIDARTDTHLWSQTYDRELLDIFAIQDDIAADVVANLQIELLNALPRARHVDPEVVALTAQAYQLSQARAEGVGSKMYALLSRALEIDPDYIPALDLLAGAYWFLLAESDLPFEEAWTDMERKVDEIHDRILELDPNNAIPDYWRAFRLSGQFELEEAAALYLRALEKDLTQADNVRFAGYFARQIGKLDASVALLRHALAIDPLCHQCRRRYADTLMFAGNYESARWEYERYLAASNEGWDDYVTVLLLQGDADEALAYLDSLDVDYLHSEHGKEFTEINMLGMRAMALYSLGEFDAAEAEFARLSGMEALDTRLLSFSITRAAAWMRKNDLAFENLFELAETGFEYLHRRTFSPIWQNLHDDPRWLEYREFNGTSPERLDAIEFDPDLPK